MFSKEDEWIETHYDKDKRAFESLTYKENITEGRFMNDIITNNEILIYSDVNTIVTQRVNPKAYRQWTVYTRKEPILWPLLERAGHKY